MTEGTQPTRSAGQTDEAIGQPQGGVLGDELQELQRIRDEVKLRVHLGGLEARDRLEELEKGLSDFEQNTRQLAGDAIEEVGADIREALEDLREGYDHLRAKLAARRPLTQVRTLVERLVQGGRQVTGRVVGSIEEARDVAGLRIEKLRLERDRQKQCARLGARIYELARTSGVSPQPSRSSEDPEVKELLQTIGVTDTQLRKRCSELEERRS